MNHRHMIPVGSGGWEWARDVAAACGAQASRGPPPAWTRGEKGSPSPARLHPPQPRPAGLPGAAGLTAFSCSSRSFILVPRRPRQVSASAVSASQESGRKWRPGRAGPGVGGGGGRRRRPARRSVRGYGRLGRAALSGPAGAALQIRLPGQRRLAVLIRPRPRPSPGPRPALLLKGAVPRRRPAILGYPNLSCSGSPSR